MQLAVVPWRWLNVELMLKATSGFCNGLNVEWTLTSAWVDNANATTVDPCRGSCSRTRQDDGIASA